MIRVLVTVFLAFALMGCSNTEHVINNDDVETEIKDEMIQESVMYYLTVIVSKYSGSSVYPTGSEEQLNMINDGTTDINLALIELEAEYDENLQEVKDLRELAEVVQIAIDNLLEKNFEEIEEDSIEVGRHIGEISRAYLNGELPTVVKTVTGVENAFE